jgi:hypothetical protein
MTPEEIANAMLDAAILAILQPEQEGDPCYDCPYLIDDECTAEVCIR